MVRGFFVPFFLKRKGIRRACRTGDGTDEKPLVCDSGERHVLNRVRNIMTS